MQIILYANKCRFHSPPFLLSILKENICERYFVKMNRPDCIATRRLIGRLCPPLYYFCSCKSDTFYDLIKTDSFQLLIYSLDLNLSGLIYLIISILNK